MRGVRSEGEVGAGASGEGEEGGEGEMKREMSHEDYLRIIRDYGTDEDREISKFREILPPCKPDDWWCWVVRDACYESALHGESPYPLPFGWIAFGGYCASLHGHHRDWVIVRVEWVDDDLKERGLEVGRFLAFAEFGEDADIFCWHEYDGGEGCATAEERQKSIEDLTAEWVRGN